MRRSRQAATSVRHQAERSTEQVDVVGTTTDALCLCQGNSAAQLCLVTLYTSMRNASYASSTWWTSAFKATTSLPSIGMTSPVSIPESPHPLASMTLSASSRCESISVNSSSRAFGSKSLRTIGNQFPKQVLLQRTCCNVSMSTMTLTLLKAGPSPLYSSDILRRRISNWSLIRAILFIGPIELLLDRWTLRGSTLTLASLHYRLVAPGPSL